MVLSVLLHGANKITRMLSRTYCAYRLVPPLKVLVMKLHVFHCVFALPSWLSTA